MVDVCGDMSAASLVIVCRPRRRERRKTEWPHCDATHAYTRGAILYTAWAKKKGLLFAACDFGSIDRIGTEVGTNQRYFILSIAAEFI